MATTTLTGTTGNDILNAPGSVTTLVAGYQGNDTITLLLDADEAQGGAGADSITIAGNAGVKSQTISGGSGNDTLYLTSAATNFQGSVNLNDGDDLFINSANIQLVGAALGGNGGGDSITLNGGVLNSLVGGGKNNDSIAVTAGTITNASIIGGGGKDTINFVPAAVTLTTVQAADGHDVVQMSGVGGSTTFLVGGGKGLDSIRLGNTTFASVAGGGQNDTIIFAASSNGGVVFGDGFGETAAGTLAGADVISLTAAGFTAATTVYGAGGNDTLSVGSAGANGLIDGGNGSDLITGGRISGLSMNVSGGAGHDTISFGSVNTAASQTAVSLMGGAGVDYINISAGGNVATINGGAANDSITFEGLSAAAGGLGSVTAAVTMTGGDGTDTIFLGNDLLGVSGLGMSVLSSINTAVIAGVTYESGTVIQVGTAGMSAANVVHTAQTGSVYVLSAVFGSAQFSGGLLMQSLTGGTIASAGSVFVFDTNGQATAGGDLMIGISNGSTAATGNFASFFTVINGGDLITTTTTGVHSLTAINATFGLGFDGTNGLTITLG